MLVMVYGHAQEGINTHKNNNNNTASQNASLHYTPDANGGIINTNIYNTNVTLQGIKVMGETGARFSLQGGNQQFALGGEVIHSKNFKSLLAAAGFGITNELSTLFTFNSAQQNAAKSLGNANYIGDLSASSFSASLNYNNSFLRFLSEKGKDTQLSQQQSVNSTTTQENLNTYLLNKTVTTTTTTTTRWNAFTRQSVLLGLRYDLGSFVQSMIGVGASKDPYNQTKTTIESNLAYYAGQWKAFIAADYRQQIGTRYNLGFAHALDKNWAMTADIYRYQPYNAQ